MEEKQIANINTNDAMLQTMFNTALFEQMQRAGNLFSKSGLVPESFQNNPAACFVGLQLATQLNINPLMLFQHLYQVHGKIGIEAQIAIGIANKSGVFTSPIRYEFKGEGKNRSCTAKATLAASGEEVEMTVDWATVEAEGWHKKAGSKWLTMPDLMFRYRSAMWLIRMFAPETILGLSSSEELADVIDVTPKKQAKTIDQAMKELNEKKESENDIYTEQSEIQSVKETAKASSEKDKNANERCKTESVPSGTKIEDAVVVNSAKDELQKLIDKHAVKPSSFTVYLMKTIKKNVQIEDLTEEEAAQVAAYIKQVKGE